jgi:hypothetical protein
VWTMTFFLIERGSGNYRLWIGAGNVRDETPNMEEYGGGRKSERRRTVRLIGVACACGCEGYSVSSFASIC